MHSVVFEPAHICISEYSYTLHVQFYKSGPTCPAFVPLVIDTVVLLTRWNGTKFTVAIMPEAAREQWWNSTLISPLHRRCSAYRVYGQAGKGDLSGTTSHGRGFVWGCRRAICCTFASFCVRLCVLGKLSSLQFYHSCLAASPLF